MDRRSCMVGVGLWALSPLAQGHAHLDPLANSAQQGGVILIRHASTEPGLGDPPGFVLGQCATQRNLSPAGREEARAIGDWFRQHRLKPSTVFSSQWCRCQDTARTAFGPFQDWPALNSTFGGQGQHEQQLSALRQRLKQLPEGVLEVWVTHQVIMTGLTGAYPAMAEGFLVDPAGTLRARGMMTPGARS